MQRACKECHLVSEESPCPACGSVMSKNWTGILSILDPDQSQLAKAMGIERAGTYALKVR